MTNSDMWCLLLSIVVMLVLCALWADYQERKAEEAEKADRIHYINVVENGNEYPKRGPYTVAEIQSAMRSDQLEPFEASDIRGAKEIKASAIGWSYTEYTLVFENRADMIRETFHR